MTNLLVENIMGIPAIHEAFNTFKEVNKYWKESTVRSMGSSPVHCGEEKSEEGDTRSTSLSPERLSSGALLEGTN